MKKLIVISLFLLIGYLYADVMQFDDIRISYQPQDSKIAAELGKTLAENISKFQKQMGHYPQLKTQIVIARDHAEYQEFMQNTEGIQEFSQAVYRHSNNTIYIRNPRDDLRFDQLSKILLHEYIHSYVFHYFINAPLWFHEGMAVYFSQDFGHSRELNLVRNYIMGNTRTLDQMQNSYPENRLEWESFYSKSALAVRYLYLHKRQEFYQLWQSAKPYRRFNTAFIKSFRYTQEDFSYFFEEYCSTHLKSQVILAMSGMIWLSFPLIFFVGYFRRRKKSQEKLAEMEAEENEKLPDYEELIEIDIDEQ